MLKKIEFNQQTSYNEIMEIAKDIDLHDSIIYSAGQLIKQGPLKQFSKTKQKIEPRYIFLVSLY
jgi:formyltetrahydrofolate synthetase